MLVLSVVQVDLSVGDIWRSLAAGSMTMRYGFVKEGDKIGHCKPSYAETSPHIAGEGSSLFAREATRDFYIAVF